MKSKGLLNGLQWPLPIKQIPIFERMNPEFSINVMYADPDETGHKITPLYASKHRGREHTVFLLLLTEPVEKENEEEELVLGSRDNFNGLRLHYVLVRNTSALFNDVANHQHKTHLCPYCFHRYSTACLLKAHVERCSVHAPCSIRFPSKWRKTNATKRKRAEMEGEGESEQEGVEDLLEIDSDVKKAALEKQKSNQTPDFILKFRHYIHTFRVPAVIYVDFESFIVKPNGEGGDDLHEPSGFCALTVMDEVFERNCEPVTFSGDGVMEAFFTHLASEEKIINTILAKNTPMNPLTTKERLDWAAADVCACCERSFTDSNHKVHHHCHASGKYIAPVCNACNLQLKFRKGRYCEERVNGGKWESKNRYFLPVIAHGMKNYDSHLIIKSLRSHHTHELGGELTCIASNSEKFISFQIGCLRFLDSYQFLNCSLETLAANMLSEGDEKFVHTKRHFKDPEMIKLMQKKGTYPYEFMDGPEKFDLHHLPPQSAFYSKLYDSGITDAEYAHAQAVWKTFNMTSMRQYHDVYLTSDVLLLADIFENFRSLAHSFYGLDPAHYYTLPGFSFDACLKMTRAKLELLTDIDQLIFIERGIRGGIATITNRYAKSNVPGTADYDPNKDTEYLMYLDANNLYGFAQRQMLPVSDFKFLSDSETRNFNVMSVSDDSRHGYVLEVDLAYPAELHDAHNDYPLAPEHLSVRRDMLSPFQIGNDR